MERKKLMLAGGLLAVGAVLFVGLKKMNQPIVRTVEVPAKQEVVEEVKQEFVLVALENIPRGRRISPEFMEWRQWPAESVAPNFILQGSRPQAMDELASAVVRSDIYVGEPINEAKLVRAGDSGLMAALLSPGMRAVTTRVSTDSAAGGFILPGDRVDIILTRQLPRRANDRARNVNQYAAATVFENVKVLAMNQQYQNGPGSPASVGTVSFATFEMNQSDAELLEETAKMGSVSLTLRSVRQGGQTKSVAKVQREEADAEDSTLIVYRNGRQTQVAVRGQ